MDEVGKGRGRKKRHSTLRRGAPNLRTGGGRPEEGMS